MMQVMPMVRLTRYRSRWWSLVLPMGWTAKADDVCATFHDYPAVGTLQISSARKSDEVSDADLQEFANRIKNESELKKVNYKRLAGFLQEHVHNGKYWIQWWLRAGSLLVYVTYVVPVEHQMSERATLEQMLDSFEAAK